MITFEQANLMKELGLPQKRHKSAKYYVTPDIIMDFESIHDLKDAKAWFEKRFDEQVNWMEYFTYVPELIDLIGIQSYDLTLDAAVYHFIENHKQEPLQDVKKEEEPMPVLGGQATKTDELAVARREGKATLGVLEYDKTVHIADRTYEGIEKIKQAISSEQLKKEWTKNGPVVIQQNNATQTKI